MTMRQVAPLLVFLVAACAASPRPVTEQRSASPTVTVVTTPSPDTAPLRMPGMEAGTKTVLKAGPRNGSMTVGDIPPGKDELWVLFRCRGEGPAEIILEPDVHMSLTCRDGVISPIMNRLDLGERRTLTVQIQVPDSVEWALRITR